MWQGGYIVLARSPAGEQWVEAGLGKSATVTGMMEAVGGWGVVR